MFRKIRNMVSTFVQASNQPFQHPQGQGPFFPPPPSNGYGGRMPKNQGRGSFVRTLQTGRDSIQQGRDSAGMAVSLMDGMLTAWHTHPSNSASFPKLERRRASLYRVGARMQRILNIADRMLAKMQRRFAPHVPMQGPYATQPMPPWAYAQPQPMYPVPYAYPQPPHGAPFPSPLHPQAGPYAPYAQPGSYPHPLSPQQEAERAEKQIHRLFDAQKRRTDLIEEAVKDVPIEKRNEVKQTLWKAFECLDVWQQLPVETREVANKLRPLIGDYWLLRLADYKPKWEAGGAALGEFEKSFVNDLMHALIPTEQAASGSPTP